MKRWMIEAKAYPAVVKESFWPPVRYSRDEYAGGKTILLLTGWQPFRRTRRGWYVLLESVTPDEQLVSRPADWLPDAGARR